MPSQEEIRFLKPFADHAGIDLNVLLLHEFTPGNDLGGIAKDQLFFLKSFYQHIINKLLVNNPGLKNNLLEAVECLDDLLLYVEAIENNIAVCNLAEDVLNSQGISKDKKYHKMLYVYNKNFLHKRDIKNINRLITSVNNALKHYFDIVVIHNKIGLSSSESEEMRLFAEYSPIIERYFFHNTDVVMDGIEEAYRVYPYVTREVYFKAIADVFSDFSTATKKDLTRLGVSEEKIWRVENANEMQRVISDFRMLPLFLRIFFEDLTNGLEGIGMQKIRSNFEKVDKHFSLLKLLTRQLDDLIIDTATAQDLRILGKRALDYYSFDTRESQWQRAYETASLSLPPTNNLDNFLKDMKKFVYEVVRCIENGEVRCSYRTLRTMNFFNLNTENNFANKAKEIKSMTERLLEDFNAIFYQCSYQAKQEIGEGIADFFAERAVRERDMKSVPSTLLDYTNQTSWQIPRFTENKEHRYRSLK